MKLNDWILNKHLRIKDSPLYYRLSITILSILFFIGIFNSLLCNEKPLVAKTMDGHFVFPAFSDFKNDLGFNITHTTKLDTVFAFALYPPVRYSFDFINAAQLGVQPPLFSKDKSSRWHTNWLGTEELGRDVTAGLARGLYHSLKIAILATFLSVFLGTWYGMVIGYIGDRTLRINIFQIVIRSVFAFLVLFYLYYNEYSWALFVFGFGFLVYKFLGKLPLKRYPIPLDTIGTSIITLRKSIPTLIIIFALLPLFSKPSSINTLLILAVIGWTSIAWIIRIQTIEIKSKDYIKSAQSLGVGMWRMILYHIYPNLKNTVLLLFIFQLGAMITIEATLSYFGVGIEPSEVSLGTLLRQAKTNINAWWLALFPGMVLFLILFCLHLIHTYHQSDTDVRMIE